MREPVYFFVFQAKTAFIPLRYLYQECLVLIEPHTQVEPLQCFRTSCPANQNCAEIIARRVNYLFEEVFHPDVEQVFAYFKMRNDGFRSLGEWIPSLGAAVFNNDMRVPRWMKINRWGFNKLKDEGTTLVWMPTDEFLFMGGSGEDILIPESSLVRLDE